MNEKVDNIEMLIKNLSNDLECKKPCKHPVICFVSWLVLSLVCSAGVLAFMGIRHDLADKMIDPYFLLEIVTAGFITISAGIAAFYLRIPDARGAGWLTAIPYAFLTVFIAWTIIRFITENATFPDMHWVHCASDSGAFIAAPLALLCFLTAKNSATTRPATMMIMQAMTVGGLGYICLRLTCAMDTMGHSLMYHILPFLVLGAIIGLLAHRLYRW
jgi:hypothetical protein